MIRVRAPRLRPRARIGITIDERGSSAAQELEVRCGLRHPAQLLVADVRPPLGRCRQERSPDTSQSGSAGGRLRSVASTSVASSRPPARTAIRDTPPSRIASMMQMSLNPGTTTSVTRRRVSASGSDPSATAPTESSRPIRSDRPAQCSRSHAPPTASPPPSPITARPHDLLGLARLHVPHRAGQRGAEREYRHPGGDQGTGQHRGEERRRDERAHDRGRLVGQRHVGGHARAQREAARRSHRWRCRPGPPRVRASTNAVCGAIQTCLERGRRSKTPPASIYRPGRPRIITKIVLA